VKYREGKPEQQPWNWYAVNQAASKVPITYTSRPNATPEAELSALAAVYKFIFDCHAKKMGRPATSGPNDAMKGSKHDRATEIISKSS
jgi:hypothetical protein